MLNVDRVIHVTLVAAVPKALVALVKLTVAMAVRVAVMLRPNVVNMRRRAVKIARSTFAAGMALWCKYNLALLQLTT